MRAEKEWRYFGSLCLAGLAGVLTSVFGCVGILGALWMQHSAIHIVPHALLLLEVPLFAAAMTLSRRFILGLWTVALVYPVAILIDHDLYATKSALLLFIGVGTLGSLLVAALSQYGSCSNAATRGTESQGVVHVSKG